MVNSTLPCQSTETNRNKSWLYEQYYGGEIDEDKRRNGHGVNNWSGAKSLESYVGQFTCDTMHGPGEYRWRHYDAGGVPSTYEGYFYNNNMHGYGVISFPDGRVFRGLFNNNMRWGPGVQSHSTMHEDVGLWRGTQLIRLSWKPLTPSIAPDLMSCIMGRLVAETHRRMLTTKIKIIGESNNGLELMKDCGAQPKSAVDKWRKLYPKHCIDSTSPLFHVERFEREYYKENIQVILEEVSAITQYEDLHCRDDVIPSCIYFAWNNNFSIINMMKHCYKHDKQRDTLQLDLNSILSGPRRLFKSAGKHEADSRALLLTSYLGYIVNVAELINKQNVYPSVSDNQGNTAVMYATCGDQADIIRFLVEAGASVDDCNDSCCTPLGVALIRFTCAVNNIPPNLVLQAILPTPVMPISPYEEIKVLEWNITRPQSTVSILHKSPSKTVRNTSSKKIKSLLSIKDQSTGKKKADGVSTKAPEPAYDSDDSLSDNKKIYSDAYREYSIKVNDTFLNANIEVPYLFEFRDMMMEIDAIEDEVKKIPEKNPKKVMSKVMKDAIKTSKVMIGQSKEKIDDTSENSSEKLRADILTKMKFTILELLTNGAKPKFVNCPQPALVLAITSNSPDLIKHLINYGADVNEIYPQMHSYSPLDIAVSRQFTWENLEVIRTLLESGANTGRGIFYEIDSSDITITVQQGSATLLHAVLARKVESEYEVEIRRHLIDLLLEYNCNPITQFKGRSAIDVVMAKDIDLFDVFIRNRKTNLNCIINDFNQSILVKMFCITFFKSIGSIERIQTLTNLLVYGADPLLPCANGQEKYENIFVFAKKTLGEIENVQQVGSQETKGKKPEKPKKDEKLSIKSMGKMVTDDKEDYRQAIELVTECARLLHIRWLQGRLVKDLILTIHKYKHRQWNMILNECKNKKSVGLWLTPHRVIEIWNILASTKKKIYNDQKVLKHLLSIVTFLVWRLYNPKMNESKSRVKVTTTVKDLIEKDVYYLLTQNRITQRESLPWKCSYVKPELDETNKKFKVCFDCAIPINESKITCNVCKLVSFCSFDCLKENIERTNCHPCSNDLKRKYFKLYNKTNLEDVN